MTTYNQAVAYNAAIPYNGGASADRTPSDHVRLEVAFGTDPDAATQAWVDLTDRLHLPSGIRNSRGRSDEFSIAQPGRLSCALENIDGALTPDNAAGAFYPNVLAQRRIRLTYRDPSTLGLFNMLEAEDASFEGGTTGGWGNTYLGAPGTVTLANSTTHPSSGTKGMRITWPTAAATCAAVLFTPPLVIGRRYTFRVVIWNTAGNPNISFGDIFGVMPTVTSSTTNAFETLSFSWTATTTQPLFGVKSAGATTSGQQTWFDAVMIDETASPSGTLGTFTTTKPTDGATPAINPRFDGYVDEWPIEWPSGGDTYSRSTITAADLLSRIGSRQKLRSVVVETMALDAPVVHFPLGEPDGSTTVSDIAGSTPSVLTLRQVGSGGALTFGTGTGVPTDGISAPQFAPASSTNGLILEGAVAALNYNGTGDVTMTAAPLTVGVSSVVCGIADGFGAALTIEVDAAGKYVGRMAIPLNGSNVTTTSAAAYNDGQTHTAAVSLSTSAGVTTLKLVVDGSATTTATAGGWVLFTKAFIGGLPTGQLFTGTISHFAVYQSALGAGPMADHRTAQSTGFAGERSDQRIARIASWIGLPAARMNLDVGNSTSVGHLDCTGMSPLDYMRKIEATEAGLLFAGTDGRLTFFNRARSYATTAPALSVTADLLGTDTRLAKNLLLVKNDVTGSRKDGATVRMVDAASRTAHGPLEDDLDVVAISDSDVAMAVGWRLFTSKTPLTRFTNVDLDAYTHETSSPTILAKVDIGARVEITGMPSQTTSTMRQTVQGYTETITDSGWSLSVNATPYEHLVVLILDDATYGVLDTYPLAY